MKSSIVVVLMTFLACGAAMPLVIPEFPEELIEELKHLIENGGYKILPIDKVKYKILPILDDRQQFLSVDTFSPLTLRYPGEMIKRLDSIPFETTTTKTDDGNSFTIGPVKQPEQSYSWTPRNPEEMVKRSEGIPLLTATETTRNTNELFTIGPIRQKTEE